MSFNSHAAHIAQSVGGFNIFPLDVTASSQWAYIPEVWFGRMITLTAEDANVWWSTGEDATITVDEAAQCTITNNVIVAPVAAGCSLVPQNTSISFFLPAKGDTKARRFAWKGSADGTLRVHCSSGNNFRSA